MNINININLFGNGNDIMTTLQDIQAKIAQLDADSKAERQEVQAALAAQRQALADLQAKLDAKLPIEQADLDALGASLDALDNSIKVISEPEADPGTGDTGTVTG